jgi:hypothetical protein
MIFILIGHVYKDEVQTKLKRKFISLPATDIDYWSISHFLLFAVFGYILPNYPLTFLILGVLFEFIEDCLSSDETTQLADCKNKYNKKYHLMCQFSINNDYWYSNWSDIFVNLFGYLVGSALRTHFFKV